MELLKLLGTQCAIPVETRDVRGSGWTLASARKLLKLPVPESNLD